VASQWTRVALNPFQVIQRSTWIPQFSLSQRYPVVRNLHNLESLTPYTNEHKSKGGIATHTRSRVAATTHTQNKNEHTKQTTELQLKEVLESLSRWTKCVFAKSRHCRMFNGCLVLCSMSIGGPFYSPKGARSRSSSIWKALVAFCSWAHRTVRCTTGQWTMSDFLPFLAKPTIASHGSRGTLDRPVRHSDRWLSHVSPADRAVDCWLSARLAHRMVRWIIAASPQHFLESGQFAGCVSLGIEHCPVHTG
jgi:hypothetical protein